MPVALNTTVATLLNNVTILQQGVPQNSSTPAADAIWNFTIPYTYWNASVWTNPFACTTCYTTVQTDNVSFDWGYLYYSLLLVLFVVALISIKQGLQRRNAILRSQAAQRRAAQIRVACTVPNNSNDNNHNGNNMSPKDGDLPPAYDDIIIPSEFMSKQSLPNLQQEPISERLVTQSPSVNNLSAGTSTLTMATDISHTSSGNLELGNSNNMAVERTIVANSSNISNAAAPSSSETRIDIMRNL